MNNASDAAKVHRSCLGYTSCMLCKRYSDMIHERGGGSKFKDPRFYELRDENKRRAMRSVSYLSENTEDDESRKEYTEAMSNCALCDYKTPFIADLLKAEIEKEAGNKKLPE
jgi:hypothetical protein